MNSGLVGFRDRRDRISGFWSQRPRLAAELMTVVDAARDLIGILLHTETAIAAGYLEAWAKSQWPMLNRLAIHGWTVRDDVSADDKLKWLTAHAHFADDHRLSHETARISSSLESAVPASRIAPLRTRLAHAQAGRSANVHLRPHLLITDRDAEPSEPTWRAGADFNNPHQSRIYENRLPDYPVTTAVAEVCHQLSGPGTDRPWARLRSYVASCSRPAAPGPVEAHGAIGAAHTGEGALTTGRATVSPVT